jgi:hypothetical protein
MVLGLGFLKKSGKVGKVENVAIIRVFLVDGVSCSHIVGFISDTRMRCSTVQDWLTHDDFFNLDLTPNANRDTNDRLVRHYFGGQAADKYPHHWPAR